MRKLIVLLTMIVTVSSHAAIECKKEGRYWYPENAKAKKLAGMLGVKTCNGKRFKAMVKKIGETSNVVTKTKLSEAEILKAFGK